MDPYVIVSEHIAAGYTEKLILRDISTRIYRGKITCVIGGSGCGKSTFLKTAIGQLPPRQGKITLLGQDVYQLSDRQRQELLTHVGFMFQYGALLNSITVEENLAIPLKAHTKLSSTLIREIIRMKLEMVHLGHAMKKLPGELSGGMRKRVGLARAIMLDPEIVFCDEPSAGLDPMTMASLDELLLKLKELLGMTMVVVTHELDSIRKIADRVVMLIAGRVHFDGTLTQALHSEDPELKAFFGRKSEGAQHHGPTVLEQLGGSGAVELPAPWSCPNPK